MPQKEQNPEGRSKLWQTWYESPSLHLLDVHPYRNLATRIKRQKEKEKKEIRTINKRGTIRGREGE